MKPKAVSLFCILLTALLLGACAPKGGAHAPAPNSVKPSQAATSGAPVGSVTASMSSSEGVIPTPTPVGGAIALPPADDQLVVHFFDVGKADSILVQQGKAAMLIDGGTADSGADIAQWLSEAGVDELQQVVVTHSDSDHVGGVAEILQVHRPQAFMMPSIPDEGKDYQHLIKAVGKMGLEITKPKPGMAFELGKANITVLAPIHDHYDTPDGYSIVLRVVFGKTAFLFTGDAIEQSETDMLMRGYDLSATVLKVGHHGQNDASTTAFLNAVHPAAAVISDGSGDGDGEGAAKKVLQRLADVGADVYRTSQAGTIVATSDGQTVAFNVAPSPPEKQKGKGK